MKNKKNVTRHIICLFLAGMVAFVACKKETSASNSGDEKNFIDFSSSSSIESSAVFDDVFTNVLGVNSDVAFGEIGVFGRIITVDSSVNPCFTVHLSSLNAPDHFPARAELDFGTGCLGKDGITRKGKIITVYSGRLTVTGSVAETSFENFYFNGVKVEGTQRIQNTSTPQQLIFKVTVKDGKLTKTNSNYSLWSSTNTITQIEGLATPYWAKDDILSITGESNGSYKNDSSFLIWESKTVEPLIKKFTCRWIVKGKLSILKTNTVAAIIDYGDGDCDNKAGLIINGLSTEITLH